MRIVVLGDTHGHDTWRSIADKETFDKIILLGDYLDSYTLQSEVIAENLKNIIAFKRELGDKCVLIYGNHDHSYFNGERCSGYNWHGRISYMPLLNELHNDGLWKIVHIEDDIIFSHAGVSDYWMRKVCEVDKPQDITFENIMATNAGLDLLDWNCLTGYDGYGDTISQSPIWIRPHSLLKSRVEGYRQVVGHTHLKSPTEIDGIYFNDMMPTHYVVVDDGVISFKENDRE